jgi:hypothetical protein
MERRGALQPHLDAHPSDGLSNEGYLKMLEQRFVEQGGISEAMTQAPQLPTFLM